MATNSKAKQKFSDVATVLWAAFGPAILYAIGEVAISLIEEKIISKYKKRKEENSRREDTAEESR